MNDVQNKIILSSNVQNGNVEYGGFWIRLLALLIDSGIFFVIFIVLGFVIGIWAAMTGGTHAAPSHKIQVMLQIFSFFVGVIYQVAFDSSEYMGTPGKIALGLAITDEQGEKISPARATGRYFAKCLSGMILGIGYIMAAFSPQKRALHDLICNTYVVKKASLISAVKSI